MASSQSRLCWTEPMSRNGGVNWASNVCVFTWNGGVMWCECPSACVLVERSGRQHLGCSVALNLKTTNVMLFLTNVIVSVLPAELRVREV